ncbi:MAG: EAL domain-containing protein, partial [Proteobacteria bacterium]
TEAEPIDDLGPRIVYCNPAFEKATGFSAQEVLGLTPRILQSKETSRVTLDKIRQALSNWDSIEVELVNARKDGSLFWVELSIVPVADEKGWFTHWISVQRDISERKEAERLSVEAQESWKERVALESRLQERERISVELAYAAYHDELTALYNRAYLRAHLEKEFFKESNAANRNITVLFIDLDGFKLVNDSLGHLAGDELLTIVAQRLQASLRSNDILARLGGDEFAIALTQSDHAEVASDLPARIIDRLSKLVELRGQDIYVSCSIGIVSADNTHKQPDDLLRDADVAMYSAKRQGRGNWVWFNSTMRDIAVNQLILQNTLRRAVIEHDFFLHYQPIYCGRSLTLVGFEALVRWQHPQLGIVKPETFIPLAEDLGLIHELGRWVMSNAAADVHRWRLKYPDMDLILNVNVSGKELARPDYVANVRDILLDCNFDPKAMRIEVTESVFLLLPDLTAKALSEIKNLGVRVGLDDFGTGYSSLSYIDQYPIDAVKIDKSFVSRMMHLTRSKAIVESILSLGRSLNIDIIAEGVENKFQLALLMQMDCPYIQGYFLSLPLSKNEVENLLAKLNKS